MNNAYNIFRQSVANIKKFGCIYDKLCQDYPLLTTDLDDMLRAQIVYVVSAMDCYFHDVVRQGIIESYLQQRAQTAKWKSTTVTMEHAQALVGIETQYPPNTPQRTIDVVNSLNNIIRPILKTMSFQQSDKIKDALSYIWDEQHKMQSIATSIAYPLQGDNINDKVRCLEQKLKLIIDRRNKIAHEADWDYARDCKQSISKAEVDDIVFFIEMFVNAVHIKIL